MTPPTPVYDTIGRSYSATRREEPRVAAQLWSALGSSQSVLNVGAGTGSYEPTDRDVVALEPSPTMIAQRRDRTDRVVRGVAGNLPFVDDSFDAALAVFTVHHWPDQGAGLRELRRVARHQVVLFCEPFVLHDFWVLPYFPEARELPSEQHMPTESTFRAHLAVREVQPLLIPRDCVDGFGAAFWARPEAYLDPDVQAGMSWLALLAPEVRARGTARLAADLESGEWHRKHADLLSLDVYDAGYRILIAEG
jgi:SAM-dependent methyltransferase